MNLREETILKSLSMRARRPMYFTHHATFTGLNEELMGVQLNRLAAKGWCVEREKYFHITPEGDAALKAHQDRPVSEGRCAPPREPWTPPIWHTRTGSQDHLAIPSRGF